MVNLLSPKTKFVFVICLAVLFCFPVLTKAYLLPKVYVTDLSVSEIKDNQIKGQFVIWNSTTDYIADLNYSLKLFQLTGTSGSVLIDVLADNNVFFAGPGQKITKSFVFPYANNLPTGNYMLRAQIVNERGNEMGWNDARISLEGINNFLKIIPSTLKILTGDKEYLPLVGAYVLPEEQARCVLTLKNDSGSDIIAVPRIRIFQRQYNMTLVKEYDDQPITFVKNKTQEVILEMPKLEKPDSYLAEVKFYKDGQQVSGIAYFRLVIEGGSGKILFIKTDKDSYKAGEDINMIVDVIGSADYSDLGTGQLKIIVYNNGGDVVAEDLRDINLDEGVVSSKILLTATRDLLSPVIKAQLYKNENILDERSITLPVFSEQAKIFSRNEKIKRGLIYLIIILAIAGFLFIFRKLKKRK